MFVCIFSLDSEGQRRRQRTATSQGNFVLRLGAGYNSSKFAQDFSDFSTTNNTLSFNPTITYMVVDNLEIGVNVAVDNRNIETVSLLSPLTKTVETGTDLGFGLFAQKYFPLNNWFAFYTAADLGIITGSYNTDNIVGSNTNSAKGNRNGVQGGLNFGFGFTPYNAFALWSNIAGIGVSNIKDDPDGANNSSSQTDIGLNVARRPIEIGVAWYFGRGLWRR